jgi:phosphoribosylamine-glycine ligase
LYPIQVSRLSKNGEQIHSQNPPCRKGGRESALAFKLSQSPRAKKIFVVPGNGGTAKGNEKVSNIGGLSEEDFPGLVKLAKELQVNLVVPGERRILH